LRAPEITAALNALTAQHEQAVASYAHDVLKDLADAEEKAGTLDQQLREAAHKAEQTVLTAPVDGTVQQLAVHTLGGVVTPAQALLTVVPDDAGMLVEAHIQNKDVGFVHAGQDVEVKVQAFEFTRYGLIHGTVLDVSRDAVAANADPAKARDANRGGAQSGDDDGQSDAGGYVAHVALRSTTVQTEDGMAALGPGMSVTAEVKTGRRRVIGYLLSPLQRYAHEGARER
jgi:hemolysin D